ANADDATAHYLLGTWYFARAMTTEALQEWDAARRLNASIPSLNASLASATLHETPDVAKALAIFEEGITKDATNPTNYSGATAAMAMMGKSAKPRVAALERYPDLKKMPSPLVYELALNKAEAGDFVGAKDLFRNRFFGREEGGLNVRQ